jgi:hypothetical protein
MKKEDIENIIKECKTFSETLIKLGLRAAGSNFKTLKNKIKIYDIDISHFESHSIRIKKLNDYNEQFLKKDIKNYLIENSTYNRGHLKERLYNEGYKKRECELCGQNENWNGKKMSLILDHINGIWNDNRIENLRIVCPNCNGTLDTHCGKKIKKEEYRKIINEKKIKNYISNRKVDRPEYQILIKEIEEIGYSATGRKYGVSDNAIRKWVKTYEKLKK